MADIAVITWELDVIREARAYIVEPGSPGTVIETTEESARRSADLLVRFDAALAALDAGRQTLAKENRQLQRRVEYETQEINKMRRVMQNAGTWDQFCSDYAAAERDRVALAGQNERKQGDKPR